MRNMQMIGKISKRWHFSNDDQEPTWLTKWSSSAKHLQIFSWRLYCICSNTRFRKYLLIYCPIWASLLAWERSKIITKIHILRPRKSRFRLEEKAMSLQMIKSTLGPGFLSTLWIGKKKMLCGPIKSKVIKVNIRLRKRTFDFFLWFFRTRWRDSIDLLPESD